MFNLQMELKWHILIIQKEADLEEFHTIAFTLLR